YVVNTTGSQGCTAADCHNYVINVLDTGWQNDGVDILTINGVSNHNASGYSAPGMSYPTDDIFLLRRTGYIASATAPLTASELADRSAFVALLHGTFG